MFEDRKERSVVYDRALSKVRCVAPALDLELARFYLEDLKSGIRRSDNPELTLARYAPQLTTSESRSVMAPVSEDLKLRLLDRFAGTERQTTTTQSEAVREETSNNIADFVHSLLPELNHATTQVLLRARPRSLFGRSAKSVGAVAVGIVRPSGVVLVDGIDLNTMTAKQGVSRTNRVVHTFWQYGRLKKTHPFFKARRIDRVGVVLNGSSDRAEDTAETHEYALDLFRQEADFSIDTASMADTERLQSLLLPAAR